METCPAPDWRRANRANWDERVGVHLGPRGYDLSRSAGWAGAARCHRGGRAAAGRGQARAASAMPFRCRQSAPGATGRGRGRARFLSAGSVTAARGLADELGLADRARFVEADVYDAPAAIPLPHGFDLVFVTWGAISWLPDITRWARIVAAMLRPGGTLYLAEGSSRPLTCSTTRPAAADGRPGLFRALLPARSDR